MRCIAANMSGNGIHSISIFRKWIMTLITSALRPSLYPVFLSILFIITLKEPIYVQATVGFNFFEFESGISIRLSDYNIMRKPWVRIAAKDRQYFPSEFTSLLTTADDLSYPNSKINPQPCNVISLKHIGLLISAFQQHSLWIGCDKAHKILQTRKFSFHSWLVIQKRCWRCLYN